MIPKKNRLESPKISIVTICLNAGDTIERAIKSVVAQTYSNVEYIVVDGVSNDSTQEIVGRYKDVITKFVSEPDEGIYHAMNKGIAMSTGDVIYFLNADDQLYDENVVRDVSDVFTKNPETDIVYGDIVWVKDGGKKYHSQDFPLSRLALVGKPIAHQSIFSKIDVFREAGPFKQEYRVVSDYEWVLKTYLSGRYRFQYIPRPIAYFYLHGRTSKERWRHETLEVLQQHYSRGEIFIYRSIPDGIANLEKLLKASVRKFKKLLGIKGKILSRNKPGKVQTICRKKR